MSNLHDKVFVALNTGPPPSPADRWTNWSRAISNRHERITARRELVVMTLVEPLRMFTSITQRLQKFAFAVFPRIQVSIGPLLQELAREQLPSLAVGQQSLMFPRGTVLRNAAVFESHSGGMGEREHELFLRTSMSLVTRSFATEGSAESTGTAGVAGRDRGQSSLTSENIRAVKEFSESPLRRLFARVHRRNPGVVLKKLLFENENQMLAERVVQDHARIELRRRGDMVVRQQMGAATAAENRSRELETQFASTKSRSPAWSDKPAAINVEELTEQVIRKIDHRITAYRERLGRAF